MPPRKKQKGKGALDTLRTIGNFVRDNRLISQGLGFIPHPGAQVASAIASQLGLGKKKRKPKKQTGKGIFSDLGGGLGSLAGGIGGGLGSLAHGLFGGKRRKKTMKL